MKPICKVIVLIVFICQSAFVNAETSTSRVHSSDIELFWQMFDRVSQEKDLEKQIALFNEHYVDKATPGLGAMMQAKRYTAQEYIDLINQYPKFWHSIRKNTYQSDSLVKELSIIIQKLKAIYPQLQPADIYFTVGALRSNGTTLGDKVLFGAEMALGDSHVDLSEFSGKTRKWLEGYYGGNPINDIVLLAAHEYIHTQQKPIANDLLMQVVYEGVAEFISVVAMEVSSVVPAITYGKKNPDVLKTFEYEMFYAQTGQWLWGPPHSKFDVRDLGYYVGYAIAENYYQQAADKSAAIKTLIELDYAKPKQVIELIDTTKTFSHSIAELRQAYQDSRPTVLKITPDINGNKMVDHNTDTLTVHFSTSMKHRRNFDYGPLGEETIIRFKREIGYSENDTTYAFEIQPLQPGKHYQVLIGSGFRDKEGRPLIPFLVDFTTKNK